jgi:hypothetical protein
MYGNIDILHDPRIPVSINVWDDGYPSGGNFWSDYTDVDLNNDGIWDHPYVIDENNIDRYPLVNPWTPTPNQPPSNPTGASQCRSDGVTVIPEGGTIPESTVVFKATVSDPDGDSVRLEIELRQIGEAFTGEPTPETISDYVPSGTQVTITRYGLINANYHWRYRAKDANGATSDWTEFGTMGNIDFTVQMTTQMILSPIYGKGIWIWRLSGCEGGDIDLIINRCKETGIKWIALKGGDGRVLWEQLNPSVIQQFRDSGIKVLGWQYIYAKYNGGPANTGGTPEQEAEVANKILKTGVDGLIIDVEDYYEGGINEATTYLVRIRNQYPGSFIAYCTYSTPEWHSNIPYKEFGKYCDAVVPMSYWGATVTPDPNTMVKEMERQWNDLYIAWKEEGNYDSIKPLIPAGWTREGKASESEITSFCKLIYDHGYFGISLWEYSQMEKEHWEAYTECFNPQLTVTAHSPVDLVITDPDVLVINKTLNEIWGASYLEFDVDGDGDLDDIVTILHGKLGNYSIGVIPEPEATPTDTFTLVVSTQTETIVLAENVAIGEIPSEPYTFEYTSMLYTFLIVWGEETFVVSVESNSTVSNFTFNQPDKEISFNVTGSDGTIGFCNVTIPKALLYGEPWTVLIDGALVPATITENETHSFLYFTYTHSTHKIQIIGTLVISPPPPPTYSLTITTTVGGTTDPAPGTYSYTANSSVQVTAIPNVDYIFDHWELDTINAGSTNPYTILMDNNHTLKAVFTYSPPPPPLSASISPLSASILAGQSVTFTSTVSGGYTPYTYQWYLNGNPVSGATSNTWTFTPITSGIYYVYLKVTDDKGNIAQSETARITVATIPVGGYSILIQPPTTAKPATIHIALLTILTALFITIKRKTKRKH